MDIKDRFLKHYKDQKLLFNEYEKIIDEYSRSDIQKENEILKNKLEYLNDKFLELQGKHKIITKENQDIKQTLKEQIIDEKTQLLKLSKAKIETYFQKAASSENSLLLLEEFIRGKISKLQNLIDSGYVKNKQEASMEIEKLTKKLQREIEDQQNEINQEKSSIKDKLTDGYRKLHDAEIDESTIAKRKKQNKLELKVGLSLFNKLGVFLILIAIGVAAKYSYATWFNDYAKGILFFAIGGIMLTLGELFFRKQSDIFSKGMIGGGIAVLYSATFFSFFALDIINMGTGLLISILITIIAVILSIRYNSRIIATFALIGGYVPFITYIFTFDLKGPTIYAGMGYLFLLNLSLLLISFRKSWKLTNYISFLLNLPSLIYLVTISDNLFISLSYSILTFIMYLSITLSFPLKYNIKLKTQDIILLGLNTIFSCSLIYLLFEIHSMDNYNGALAMIFAITYIGLGVLLSKKMKKEKESIILFFGTALTFVVLMVPLQFGIAWLSMGWLIEGLILSIMGFRYKIRKMEFSGWLIFAISVFSFFLFDFLKTYSETPLMEFKFTMVIVSMVILMVIYLLALKWGIVPNYSKKSRGIQKYKVATIISFYLYLLYMGNYFYSQFTSIPEVSQILTEDLKQFYNAILIVFIHIALAIVLPRIKLIKDRIIKFISIALNLISVIICLWLVYKIPVLQTSFGGNSSLNYFAFVLLIIFNIVSIFRVRKIVISFLDLKKGNFEIYPVIFSTYLLGVLTSAIIFQFDFGNINLIISFLFLLFAIGNITFGFLKRFAYIRMYGLALSLFSTGKLFLYDLRHLSTGGKIIAYFGFGVVLILISFIYQKIKKETEIKDVKNY